MNNNIDFEQIKLTVLPYFIQIYGEEYRDIIVDRLNKIEPIFYSDLDSDKSIMNRLTLQKSDELTIKFLEANNIYLPEELKEEIIKNGNIYKLNDNLEAQKLLDICYQSRSYFDSPYLTIRTVMQVPLDEKYKIRRNVEFFQKLDCDVNEENYNDWIMSEEATRVFEKINDLLLIMNKLDEEYHEFDKQFDDFKKIVDKGSKIRSTIEEQYMLEFLDSIKQYMDEHDKKVLENYLNSDNKDYYYFKKDMNILQVVGDSIMYSDEILNAFSSKSDEKLNDPETYDYVIKNIKRDRLKYYKIMNIYKGEMSEDEFLNSDIALSKRIPQAVADEILTKKEKYRNLCEEKYLEETSSYKSNIEEIKKMGFVTEAGLDIETIKKGIKCVNPNVRIVNGKPEAVALLLFSVHNGLPEYIDVTLIHEINHAVELSLIDYSDGKEMYKCGFEYLLDDDSKRIYTQFSEVMNQIIAIEITEAMHNDNIYLFDDPKTSKTRGGTSYEHQRQFIQTFWQSFRKDIMYARVNNNMDSLFATIGRENFEELNNIINDFQKLPYYNLLNDLKNNKTTELTMQYNVLVERTVAVQNKMMEHANNYEKESLGKVI